MNVLIINLTRFGDLLQMQPLILELQAQGHSVGLVCLGNFAPATVLLRGLSFVAPLQGGDLLRHLDERWHKALGQAESFFSHIQENFAVEQVINTTATISARILARRIAEDSEKKQGKHVPLLGFGLDNHGFGVSGNMWATFLQGASAERLNCPFNMVDMFRALASTSPLAHKPPLRGLQKVHISLQQAAKDLLLAELPAPYHSQCQGYVALQLGASEARRQWALEHFAAVGTNLWHEQGLCPVLLGSPAEKGLGEGYAKHVESAATGHPFINVIGRTDIPHLAAVLQECSLLITNDTGTMHLAAGLDVPVLSLFLATAQAFDTGPYMPNACCLEPNLPCHPCAFHSPCVHQQKAEDTQPCLSCISPTLVHELAVNFLQQGQWQRQGQNQPQTLAQQSARIWITEEDGTGFAFLRSISGHEQEERSHWLTIQRYFYRHILDDNQEYTALPSQSITALSAPLREHICHTLRQCSELLFLLTEQLHMLTIMPSPTQGQRILSTCNTIHQRLQDCNHLKALSYLWLVLFQERGGALESFGQLVHSLRAHLEQWHKALDLPAEES